MTIKNLMDILADYDPDQEVYLYMGPDAECYDEIGRVAAIDHSPSASWFFDEFDACDHDDCRKVVAIMPKNW